jgi:hypothetical protein
MTMKTLVIKADDALVERLSSLLELLSKNQYEMKIVSDTSEESSENMLPHVSLKRGSAKDMITYIAEDFDAPLDDFKDYMS